MPFPTSYDSTNIYTGLHCGNRPVAITVGPADLGVPRRANPFALHACGRGGGAGLPWRFPPSLPGGLYLPRLPSWPRPDATTVPSGLPGIAPTPNRGR
ncbi:hypothetical protein MTO96_052192 [Rhipicephalus appendiculatus]